MENQIQYKILKLLNKTRSLNKHEIAYKLKLNSDSTLSILMYLKNKGKIAGQSTGRNKPYLWYPKV